MSKLTLLFLIVTALGATGCDYRDYYSEVAEQCAISRAECALAIEPLLPFDEESFKAAPSWFKGKVAEGFAAMVWYPLKFPPENRIFGGVAPYSIPDWHIRILTRDSNLNQSLFNHMMNIIQTITYDPLTYDDHVAMYTYHLGSGGTMKLNSNSAGSGSLPPVLAMLYIHEGHHGDGYYHNVCGEANEAECDSELSGPRGLATTYRTMLLHGSGQHLPERLALLNVVELYEYEKMSCGELKARITAMPAELKQLLEETDCERIDYPWVVEHEGLTR